VSGNSKGYTLGINLSGTANGSETLTVNPANNSIYDLVGNVASTSQSNNSISLIDNIAPFITNISNGPFMDSRSSGRQQIIVTFNEAIYNTASGSGSIEANDFVLSLSGGDSPGLASTTPTHISPTPGQANSYTLAVYTQGLPNGLETLTVNPVNNSIYDLTGNVASTSQSNNTINLINQHVLDIIGSMNDGGNSGANGIPTDINGNTNYTPSESEIYTGSNLKQYFVIKRDFWMWKRLGFLSYQGGSFDPSGGYLSAVQNNTWWSPPSNFVHSRTPTGSPRQISLWGGNVGYGELIIGRWSSYGYTWLKDTILEKDISLQDFMWSQNLQSNTETRGEVGYITISGTGTFSDYMVYERELGPYYLGSTIIKPDTGYHGIVWDGNYTIGDNQVFKITYNYSTNDYIISPTNNNGLYNIGSLHSNYSGGPGNPSNPTLTITKTTSGNWTLYEKTKNGYIICESPSGLAVQGMGVMRINLSATTSTAGVEYNLTFI
jgi:hypothetical protein